MKEERWFVYYWNYGNPDSVQYEVRNSREEAAELVDQIFWWGDNWDAYMSQDPPEEFENKIW